MNGWWRQWRAHRQRWMNTDDRQWGSCRRHGNSRGRRSEQKNENRRKGGNKRGKKKAALGAGQHDEVVQHSEGSRQEGEEVVAAYTPRAEGEEAVAPG